ncbi:hypothetical protein BH11CYA1_BH11CYA1_33680 [soil metagenome]
MRITFSKVNRLITFDVLLPLVTATVLSALALISEPALAGSGEKPLVFPSSYSSGWILDVPVDPGLECNIHGKRLAKAQGVVKIATGKHLKFEPSGQFFRHPECMLKLPPNAFDYLELSFSSMEDSEESFSNKIIPFVLHLKGLKAISLDKTDTTDNAAAKLGALPNLQCLSFSESLVTSKCLMQLQNCKSLRFLRFGGVQIDEPSLQYLSQLPNLKRLTISHTNLTKNGLEQICKCKGLINLSISKNPAIDDSCITLLLKLKNLKILDLAETKITMAGLERLTCRKDLDLCPPLKFSCYSTQEKARLKKLFPDSRFDRESNMNKKMNSDLSDFFDVSK